MHKKSGEPACQRVLQDNDCKGVWGVKNTLETSVK
jgi:hypothetical protein